MRNTPITQPNQADYMSPSETNPTLDSTRDAASKEAANIRKEIDNQSNPAQKSQPLCLIQCNDRMSWQGKVLTYKIIKYLKAIIYDGLKHLF